MPKKSPVLNDWDYVYYQETIPNPNGDIVEGFTVYRDGSFEDTNNPANGTWTTETGTITRKELKQLDALLDEIFREPNPQQSIVSPDDDPGKYISTTVDAGPELRRLFTDYQGDSNVVYLADDQTDVQEIDALNAYLRVLDSRYGSDLA